GALLGRRGGLRLALVRLAVPGDPVGRHLGLALAQPGRLADALAEVVQLRPPNLAGALHLDLGDLRRVQREDALDALALDDAADGEHLAHALVAHADDDALEDLHALLLALEDALVDLHLVADGELGDFLLDVGKLRQAEQFRFHDSPSPVFAVAGSVG